MSEELKPKISVIIPVYNAEKYLERCLTSVTSQTLREIEIFCIDDGSTDRSWNIIQEFAKRDKRIFAIRQENSGAAVARNKGLERATGEYVGFVDSDDYVDKDYFEQLYKTAKNKKADIAVAYVKAEIADDSEASKKEIGNPKEYEDYFNVFSKSTIEENKLNLKNVLWRCIYKKSILEKYNVTFHSELRTGQDNIFNLEVSYYANRIEFVDEPTYYHRVARNGSLMTSFNYTDGGLVSRSLVFRHAVEFLNSKPDYSKEVYISRVLENINFLQQRLQYTSKISAMRRISAIVSATWKKIKYKENIIPALQNMDSEFVQAVTSNKKLFWYIYKVSHPRISKIVVLTKRAIKAILPYGVVVLYKKYRSRTHS